MAQPRIPVSYADLAWAWAGDPIYFESRPGTNDDIIQLKAQDYLDEYLTDPTITRLTVGAGSVAYDAVNERIYGGNNALLNTSYYNSWATIKDTTLQAVVVTQLNKPPVLNGRINVGTGARYICVVYNGTLYIQRFNTWPALGATLGSFNGGFPHGVPYELKFEIVGTALRAKYWPVGGVEPGWQVDVSDGTLTSGYIGVGFYAQSAAAYLDDFTATDVLYSTTSPRYIFRTDSDVSGSVWAAGTFDIGANLDVSDTATVTVYEAYSDTAWGPGDEALILAALGPELNIVGGQVTLTGGTGRYRYIVVKVASDGIQQGSFILLGTGQDVTICTTAVDIQGNISDVTLAPGDTLSVTGNIQASVGVNVTLTVKIRKKSDDALITTLFSNTVDLVLGANDIPTLCGGSCQWVSTGAVAQQYYAEVKVADGGGSIIISETDKLYFEVMPTAGIRYEIV